MKHLRKYISVPYRRGACGWDGSNCWGLVRLFYEAEKNILLPVLEKRELEGRDGIAQAVEKEAMEEWEPTKKPVYGDVLVFNIIGQPRHIAIYLSDTEMLHVEKGKNSCVENYKSPIWAHLLVGFYKYAG